MGCSNQAVVKLNRDSSSPCARCQCVLGRRVLGRRIEGWFGVFRDADICKFQIHYGVGLTGCHSVV